MKANRPTHADGTAVRLRRVASLVLTVVTTLLGLLIAGVFVLAASTLFDPSGELFVGGLVASAMLATLGVGVVTFGIRTATRLLRPNGIVFASEPSQADYVISTYKVPGWFSLVFVLLGVVIAFIALPYEAPNAASAIRQIAYAMIYLVIAPSIAALMLFTFLSTRWARDLVVRIFGARPAVWYSDTGVSVADVGTIPWANVVTTRIWTSYTKAGPSVRLIIECRDLPPDLQLRADWGGDSVSVQLRLATVDEAQIRRDLSEMGVLDRET